MVSFTMMNQMQEKTTFIIFAVVGLGILLFSSCSEAYGSTLERGMANFEVVEGWPSGTRLLIPDRVMKDFQKVSEAWSQLSTFFFANYFVTGPTLRDKRTETVYLPFVKAQVRKVDRKEVWMAIATYVRDTNRPDEFKTTEDVYVIQLNPCLGCEIRLVGAPVNVFKD